MFLVKLTRKRDANAMKISIKTDIVFLVKLNKDFLVKLNKEQESHEEVLPC